MIGFKMRHLFVATFLFSDWCWRDVDPACQADVDGDGFSACEDCDDQDAAVHPDAEEIAGNCADEDCDALLTPAVESEDVLAAGAIMLCGDGNEEAGTALVSVGATVPGSDALLVGARLRDKSGAVYMLDGEAMGGEAVGQLLPLRELASLTLIGASSYEAGTSIAALSLDSDGLADVFVGAPGVSVGGIGMFGAVYMVSTDGLSGDVSLAPEQPNTCPESAAFCLVNTDLEAASLGKALAAGRVEDDANASPFLLATAPGFNQDQGAVVLVRGSSSFSDRLLLGDDGTLMLSGPRVESGFGQALAVGALDGDGTKDALIGTPGLNLRDVLSEVSGGGLEGGVYAAELELSDVWQEDIHKAQVSADELLLYGVDLDQRVGAALATGDLTGEGGSDIAVGTHCTQAACTDSVWLVPQSALSGGQQAVEEARNLKVTWEGPDDQDGPSFSPMPPRLEIADVDGDGQADLLIGRPASETEAGSTWVILGPRAELETISLEDVERSDVVQIGPFVDRERLGFALEGGVTLAGLDLFGLGAPRAFDGGGAVYGLPLETFPDDL